MYSISVLKNVEQSLYAVSKNGPKTAAMVDTGTFVVKAIAS